MHFVFQLIYPGSKVYKRFFEEIQFTQVSLAMLAVLQFKEIVVVYPENIDIKIHFGYP
jgi:hypothetical protein